MATHAGWDAGEVLFSNQRLTTVSDAQRARGGVDDGAETILAPDTPFRGLHRVSLGVNLIPRAWQTIRGL